MIDARFRPVDRWPGQRTSSRARQQARFRVGYRSTLDLLETELRHLRARDIIIQAGFSLSDIRNDGWPRSNARRPDDPGVIVSFVSPKGALSFPCDRYTEWEDNLRAIALSLEALRAVDRYGVTQHAEQYRGWQALPPAQSPDEPMSPEAAAEFLARHGGIFVSPVHTDPAALDAAYRNAARVLHPDAGGDHELFVKLQQAKATLLANTEAR